MRILFFILAISGCKTANPVVSEPEFMTLPQSYGAHAWKILEGHSRKIFLTNHIHQKEWKIHYGIVHRSLFNSRGCNKEQREKLQPKLTKAITKAIRIWLEPVKVAQESLKDFMVESAGKKKKIKQTMVDNFNFHYLKPKKSKIFLSKDIGGKSGHYGVSHYDLNKYAQKDRPHLSIVFYCEEGRSYMLAANNEIHLFEIPAKYRERIKTTIPDTHYNFASLLHELGHTFGLADTYTDYNSPARAHMTDHGVHYKTIGKQPITVMGPHHWLNYSSYDDVKITEDDSQGIRWLYIYLHVNKLPLDSCPSDYIAEHYPYSFSLTGRKTLNIQSVACTPKHPLIFAIRTRNYSTARAIINNPLYTKVNDRDEDGNTALHYAVALSPVGFVEALLNNFKSTIDLNITNNKGVTAYKVAQDIKRQEIINLLDEHKLRLDKPEV